MQRFGFVLAGLAFGLGCCSSRNGAPADPRPPEPPTFTLFALAELRGQIEPCGCTTDPLGDLARTVQLVQSARAKGPVLVVDAGSMLYTESPVPPHLVGQERLKSDLLVATYDQDLEVAAIGLGPNDLGMGNQAVRPPRQAVNVAPGQVALAPPRVVEAGGAKVGIFGVVVPGMLPGIEITPAGPAALAAMGELRGQGAEVIVALVQAPDRRAAVELVRSAPGIDVAIAGLGAQTPEPERVARTAERIGDAWLVVPANRGQVVSRIEITRRAGKGPLVDAIGVDAASALREQALARAKALEEEIAGFEKSPDADPAFVAGKRSELAATRAEAIALEQQPLRPPAEGSYFTLTQVTIKKSLACATEVQDRKLAFSKAAGAANVAAAAGKKAPPPGRGQAGFVGRDGCADCHEDAVTFWETTRHANAFATLDTIGKQFDYDCIGCHITGFAKPGGSTLADNEPLRDVQCETCHGPGSIHVDRMGKEKPRAILPGPDENLCRTECHTPEHSDTFDHKAYLRDITGKGHGEAFRLTLGDGPTGRELRAAGLAKAGKAIGAGCLK